MGYPNKFNKIKRPNKQLYKAICSVFLSGGDDGSRTRVQKEFCQSISGCSLSLGFPRLAAGKQAARVGSFMSS